jgi:hypothetical protein
MAMVGVEEGEKTMGDGPPIGGSTDSCWLASTEEPKDSRQNANDIQHNLFFSSI